MTNDLTDVEAACIEAMRTDRMPRVDAANRSDWLTFGLVVALEACRTIRGSWASVVRGSIERKPDGTPGIPLERDVETMVRRHMGRFAPAVPIVGEEAGGSLPDAGWALAIDPIDGTWAFFNGTEAACVSLGLFEDGRCVAGIVANPATGEIAYGGDLTAPRLLRISVFGEGDRAMGLPVVPEDRRGVPIVSVHPDRTEPSLIDRLRRAWSDGEIRSLRAPGGSPAWGIIDAAKGRYTYVNAWTSRAAEPFDLAAAVAVLRAAGGEAVDLQGAPIDSASHAGPFVAGIDATVVRTVTQLVRDQPGRAAP
jgi:fructose-1,6-bisphosphatase/inositol monophosphatase family enzyme